MSVPGGSAGGSDGFWEVWRWLVGGGLVIRNPGYKLVWVCGRFAGQIIVTACLLRMPGTVSLFFVFAQVNS